MDIEKNAKETILKSLGIDKIDSINSAFNMVIDSIATISMKTNIRDLKELIKTVDFSPLKSMSLLSESLLSSAEKMIQERVTKIDAQRIRSNQIQVQRLLQPSTRKKLAAYFTKQVGLNLMSRIVSEYSKICDYPLSLCDPFLGSGLTLSEILQKNKDLNIGKVWGVEPHPLTALVAYSAILQAVNGDLEKVEVFVGDAFKLVALEKFTQRNLPRSNVILTNPPFTRWEILDKNDRIFLTKLIERLGYSKYVNRKQMNLQVWSLFLMDYILEHNGLLISVLPASTFYTIYGETVKKLLNEKYQIHALIEYKREPSFSIDSGFKELILISTKGNTFKDTAFVTLNQNSGVIERLQTILSGEKPFHKDINWVNTSEIPSPWNNNWLTLFGSSKTKDLLSKIFAEALKKGSVDFWRASLEKKSIVRGVEMYGPDFFFVPNRYWKIAEENVNCVILENSAEKMVLRIGKEFLNLALRRPEFYKSSIIPLVEHFLLSIPPKPFEELPENVVEYIEWGSKGKTAIPAIRSFGKFWYSHVHKQLKTKKPFGRVFLPDKIDPSFRTRAVFSCYSDQPITASKNFYIVTLGNKSLDKAISAWFNCTIFIAYFLISSRKISDRWTRFLEEDYLRMPIIKLDAINRRALEEIVKIFDGLADTNLPSIRSQIGEHHREQLDRAILDALGFEGISCKELHNATEECFTEAEAQ